MSARALVVFLTLVLFWSGFATHEQALATAARAADAQTGSVLAGVASTQSAETQRASAAADLLATDVSTPGQAEGLADGLLPDAAPQLSSALAMAAPGAYAARLRPEPCLAGPQRPPCVTAFAA